MKSSVHEHPLQNPEIIDRRKVFFGSQQNQVFLLPLYVVKQSLRNFYKKKNYVQVKWIKYSWNPHQNPKHTDRSKILDSSQWNKVFSLPKLLYVVKQIMSNFFIRTELRRDKWNQVFTSIQDLSKIQMSLIREKYSLDPSETKFFRFHYML